MLIDKSIKATEGNKTNLDKFYDFRFSSSPRETLLIFHEYIVQA